MSTPNIDFVVDFSVSIPRNLLQGKNDVEALKLVQSYTKRQTASLINSLLRRITGAEGGEFSNVEMASAQIGVRKNPTEEFRYAAKLAVGAKTAASLSIKPQSRTAGAAGSGFNIDDLFGDEDED